LIYLIAILFAIFFVRNLDNFLFPRGEELKFPSAKLTVILNIIAR